jgi:phage gp16-like protein
MTEENLVTFGDSQPDPDLSQEISDLESIDPQAYERALAQEIDRTFQDAMTHARQESYEQRQAELSRACGVEMREARSRGLSEVAQQIRARYKSMGLGEPMQSPTEQNLTPQEREHVESELKQITTVTLKRAVRAAKADSNAVLYSRYEAKLKERIASGNWNRQLAYSQTRTEFRAQGLDFDRVENPHLHLQPKAKLPKLSQEQAVKLREEYGERARACRGFSNWADQIQALRIEYRARGLDI